ncbi:DPBB and LysM peptidoglycan-binding domain-containing protein [Cyclobacterium plantarum]|uniref:LysM peptidoglycan-binding domain-containing protein n=1 Tax=Cyclobacterium plantarum TaxID=2716263 RepID=A0ABX0HF26_9BACT|nr:LysM peptidoglycan-binding domain-containing protein [Cyclobacterium plantarum]NHE59920.1 LysM peptidoglycan-binding domain-containing protein [Cyclobacterium plantarum]
MKYWILILGLIGIALPSEGNILVSIDSVGIEREGEKSYIIHQVEPQETLFAISRRYGAPVGDIVQSNDNLKAGLKSGQRIRVPFVEKVMVSKDAKIHKVIPGETLFSISKSYQVEIEELMEWNDLKGNDLSVGQALIIKGLGEKTEPVAKEKIEETAELADQTVAVTNEKVSNKPEKIKPKKNTEDTPGKNESPVSEAKKTPDTKNLVSPEGNWISHQVAQGETLFAIARKYDSRVEDLIQWNGLSSNNLSIGQTLKVGREVNPNIPVSQLPAPKNNTTKATPENPRPERKSIPSSSGSSSSTSSRTSNVSTSTAFRNVKESGQAEVIEGTGNHKKYLALHRTAPVGTIMRIRNEENDVTVFARVVGVLPETGDNNKLLIKVSKAAFDQLKAVNSRFRVEVSY